MAAFLAPFLISLATSVVLGIASQLIRGSPRGPKPLVQDEFKLPTTEDGREIPWIFGRVVCAGPNVLYYKLRGNQRIRRRSGLFSRTTVGRRYDFGIHFGICSEPEIVHAIRWGGKDAVIGPYTVADDTSRLQIRLDDLFGGDDGEGGLNGDMQILFGAPDQVLAGNILEDINDGPNFRGWLSLYWRGICTTTPYIKPVEVEVSRYTAGWESGSAWYPETAYVPLNEIADGERQEFTFMFVIPSGSQMNEELIPLSPTPTRFQMMQTLIDQAFTQLITLKNTYGDGLKLNVTLSLWDSSLATFSEIDATASELDTLRDYIVGLGGGLGNYFYTTANNAVTASHAALDGAGVTGPRTMFFLTGGADGPSFIDGPIFGTPDSRTAALVAGTTDMTNSTGAFAPGSGRETLVYRTQLGVTTDGLTDVQVHNAPTAPILVQGGGGQIASIISAFGGDNIEEAYFGANAAHIIYELITTARPRGMGYPTSAINASSFTAAADRFYSERLGLCVKWEFSGSVRELMEEVASHAGAIVSQSPTTGLWKMTPLRKDYTAGTLPLFNESNILRVATFERAAGGEQLTSISGKYRDVFVREDRVTPPARNLALIQQQAADITEQRDYPYAPTATIAARLVDRDLQLAGLPLALIEIECNREAYNVEEGDVIRVADARIGVNPIIMRVLSVDEGTLQDGAIVLRGNEDQFGLADNVYTEPQPVIVSPVDERPLPTTQFTAYELPYQIVSQPGGPSSVADGIGYVGALAAPPANLLTDYDLYTGVTGLTQDAIGQFIPAATLAVALNQTDTELLLANEVNFDAIQIGDYAIVGTGDDAEWMLITDIGDSDTSVTVSRGLMDTTPALTPWPIGTSVWFSDGTEAVGETAYTDGDDVIAAIATRSPQGLLDPALSPQATVAMANRANRPLPPGNVLVNTEAYPTTITGALTITWSARDRLVQPDDVLQTNATDFGPESGTTYNVWAYDVTTETLLASDTGLTVAEWEPVLPDAYPLRIEIEAERDGLVSWQRQKRQFAYVGAGLEGFVTDDATETTFETDGGDVLLTD